MHVKSPFLTSVLVTLVLVGLAGLAFTASPDVRSLSHVAPLEARLAELEIARETADTELTEDAIAMLELSIASHIWSREGVASIVALLRTLSIVALVAAALLAAGIVIGARESRAARAGARSPVAT